MVSLLFIWFTNILKSSISVTYRHSSVSIYIFNSRIDILKLKLAVFLLVLSWAVPWSIVGSDCLPGGNLFGLIILIDCCILAGKLVDCIRIPKLPPLPSLLGKFQFEFFLQPIFDFKTICYLHQ